MTKIVIPEEHINKNRRANYSFLWQESGEFSDFATKHGLEKLEFDELLQLIFPYSVKPAFSIEDFSEGGDLWEETHEWLRNNLKGIWTIWATNGDFKNNHRLMFTEERDAVLFKLHWG